MARVPSTARMLAAGTNIVGGVNARKAGTTVPIGAKDGSTWLNVFGSVAGAMEDRRELSPSSSFPGLHQGSSSRGYRGLRSALSSLSPRAFRFRTPQSSGQLLRHPWTRTANRLPASSAQLPRHHLPEECLVGIIPANITGKGKIDFVSRSVP